MGLSFSRTIAPAGLSIFILVPSVAAAAGASGTIDAAAFSARVCHSADCATPPPGSINFRPTGATPVTIGDVSGLDGVAWGNELGWITFDPTGPEQVTINSATGALSGKAWSQVSGWINFRPTGYGVSITNQGEFIGWAWAGGPYGGWIKFDCSAPASCVRTDWRPLSARSTPSTSPANGANGPVIGGTGAVSPSDLCPNFEGTQFVVPEGYELRENACEPLAPDVCQNLPGVQAVGPANYVSDEGGFCRLIVDHCPNLPDVQLAVPPGYGLVAEGVCLPARTLKPTDVTDDMSPIAPRPGRTIELETMDEQDVITADASKAQIDRCPDRHGVQAAVPVGYRTDAFGNCVPQSIDYCPNLPGQQTEIPSDLIVDDQGACIATIVDTEAPVAPPSTPAATDATSNATSTSTMTGIAPLATAVSATAGLGWLLYFLLLRRWGRVFDIETGQPLEGVRLLLYHNDGCLIAETTANHSGRYGFRVRPGSYQLRVVRADYALVPGTSLHAYDGGIVHVGWTGCASLDVALRAISQQH